MRQARRHTLGLALALAAWLASGAGALTPTARAADADGAATSIGMVKSVHGQAWIVTGARSETATLGASLYEGSTLRTGPGDSTIGIALKDNTLISLGPSSELSLDEYRFAPAEGTLGLVVSMTRGTMEFLTGMIARLRPDSVVVKTPTGTLGVRGTRFLVKLDE